MADDQLIPDNIPPMGAEFKKPYMEFEYDGEIYKLEDLKGGHNGIVAKACETKGAKWDEQKQRWVVEVRNNLIDIDLSKQPESSKSIPESKSFLKQLKINSSSRRSKQSIGYLLTEGKKNEQAMYPLDCEFHMHIRVKVPGKPSLINPVPFKLVSKGLKRWPPPIGTIYTHEDTVEMYPEWIPFGQYLMKPIVKILPGDETIITEVFEAKVTKGKKQNMVSRLMNWLT